MKKLIITGLLMLGQLASAECYIRVDQCKPMGIKTRTTFQDGEVQANIHPGRCLERAREYKNWCNSANEYVGAIAYVNGQLTLAVYIDAAGASQLYTVTARGGSVAVKSSY